MHLINKGKRSVTYLKDGEVQYLAPLQDAKVPGKEAKKLLKMYANEIFEASKAPSEESADVKKLQNKVKQLTQEIEDAHAKIKSYEEAEKASKEGNKK